MKTLNLAYPEKSNIKFTHQKFPDGQRNIVITSIEDTVYMESFKEGFVKDGKYNEINSSREVSYPITIKTRLNNFTDLELIICATKSLRNLGVKEIHLYSPYLLGARSDRKFETGGNNYLKDIVSPIINSLNFESVTVMDPHSYVTEACINNFKKKNNDALVRWGIAQTWKGETKDMQSIINNCILIAPDAGATHKIYKLAEQIGYKGDIITCSKERDNDGKIKSFHVNGGQLPEDKDMIIIDDICDGGRTFIETSEQIRDYLGDTRKGKIYLIVTHGIFSKGLTELSKYFDGIYSTNSYSDWDYSDLKVGEKQLLTQLNVF